MVSQKVFLFLGSDKCYSCILDTFYAIFHVIDENIERLRPRPRAVYHSWSYAFYAYWHDILQHLPTNIA